LFEIPYIRFVLRNGGTVMKYTTRHKIILECWKVLSDQCYLMLFRIISNKHYWHVSLPSLQVCQIV